MTKYPDTTNSVAKYRSPEAGVAIEVTNRYEFDTIAEAAEFVGVDAEALLEALELRGGEFKVPNPK